MVTSTTEPYLFVIMGTLGDLTGRKLLPSLYHLWSKDVLSQKQVVLGIDMDEGMDDDGYRDWTNQMVIEAELSAKHTEVSRWCKQCLYYHSIGAGRSTDYLRLAERITALEKEHNLPGNRVFYMALPSATVPSSVASIGKSKLNRSTGWTRLVMEKPFGMDIASARELNTKIHRYFSESQIYRIDHFLGKETVQNLLVFRFANTFFEHLWNWEHVESVEITAAETLGIERRVSYYERSGALRDMIQNHLTQVLSLMAMEVPSTIEETEIRYEKIKVLRQIAPIQPEDAVFGQYARGTIDGVEVPAYREESGVSPQSQTETFAALKLEIANRRWQGVPFFLRTGKRLPHKYTQIVIQFHCAPVSAFHPFESSCAIQPNILVITLQPDEGFDLHFHVKAPGHPFSLSTQQLICLANCTKRTAIDHKRRLLQVGLLVKIPSRDIPPEVLHSTPYFFRSSFYALPELTVSSVRAVRTRLREG